MPSWFSRLPFFRRRSPQPATQIQAAIPVPCRNPVPRFPCPFRGGVGYAIDLTTFVFVGPDDDYNANGCALKFAHSPCGMESHGLIPNWHQCPFKHPKNETELNWWFELGRCYPYEFKPEGVTSWEGMRIADFAKYVMSDQCPRPPGTPRLVQQVLALPGTS